MKNQFPDITKRIHSRRYAIYSSVIWTILLLIILNIEMISIRQHTLDRAYIYTKVGFEKDVIFRRWVSEHGGVYVYVDSLNKPNPYLSDLPQRDILIDSNSSLTLINPAYMTRQMHELQRKYTELRGHITSLNPIRPENAPDQWEIMALESFVKGEPEYFGIDTIAGKRYLRYMQPLLAEASCLKCHKKQDYQLNDIIGGLSVSYPEDRFNVLTTHHKSHHYYLYFILWVIGLAIILAAYFRIRKDEKTRMDAETKLFNLNKELEVKIEERSRELQKSRRDWETIFNIIGYPVQLIGKDHIIKYVNEATLTNFNLKRDDIIGKKCHTLFHQKEEPPKGCPLRKAMHNNSTSRNEMLVEIDNKEYIVSCSPIFDPEGKLEFFLHIMTDISSRKEIERQLKRNQSFTESILNTSPDIIYIYDIIDKQNIYSNLGITRILGYTIKEIKEMGGNVIPNLMHPEDLTSYLNNIVPRYQMAKDEEIIQHEYRMKHKNGSWVWLLSKETIFLRQADGTPKQIFGFTVDVTIIKKSEVELEKYRKNLEDLVKERTHELEEKTKELEELNSLFVGRELRMIELKEELKRLKKK